MKTITIFLWCLVGLVLGTVVALGQNPTPIANLQRATTVYTTNIIPVVTNPGQTNGTKGVELDDFLASLVGFPGWPSVSVTNAIGTVKTNGTTITASATSINFVQGSNTVVRATNTAGAVSIEINAAAGSGSVNTNLQIQSLKVYGQQTNAGDIIISGGSYPKVEITSLTAPTVMTLDTGGLTTSAQNNQPYISLEPQGVLSASIGTNYWIPGSGFGLGSPGFQFATGYFGLLIATNVRPSSVGASKLLRTDSSTNAAEVTIGSGLTFDGTTLAASGGGGGGGGSDIYFSTNGTQIGYGTNFNFVNGFTGFVSGATVTIGQNHGWENAISNLVNTKQHGTAILTNISGTGAITNLNWSIIASTTNVNGVSNYVGAISNYVDTASSNRVRLAAGSGGITVSQSGSGGVQTWTINDDDAGSGSSLSYAAIPTSGIVGGSTYGWTTNLSGNLMVIASNLTANVHYFIDIRSAGYVASISNYQSFYFRDAGLGGISSFGTNGSSTLEIWKDTPTGLTNAIMHGPEASLVVAGGPVLITNSLTRTITHIGGLTVATNGVTVGSGTNVNWTSGVTGYVSGATLNLGIAASGGGGSLPGPTFTPSYGAQFESDGQSTNWTAVGGGLIMSEEFWGDTRLISSGSINHLGSMPWWAIVAGTVPGGNFNPINLGSEIGMACLVTTQAASSILIYSGQSSGSGSSGMYLTNADTFAVFGFAVGQTNNSSEIGTFTFGLSDNKSSSSATLSPNNLLAFQVNTNSTNSLVCKTARSTTTTSTYTSATYNPVTRYFGGIYVSRWVTNAVFYFGTNLTSMVPIATNSSNLPLPSTPLDPFFLSGRMTTTSGAIRNTNFACSVYIWRKSYD